MNPTQECEHVLELPEFEKAVGEGMFSLKNKAMLCSIAFM